jgi:thiamine-phosphate pyrophosphorylase
VDVDTLSARGIDVLEFAARVLAARPPLLQLRAKTLGAAATLTLLERLRPLCDAVGTLLFANDRPDLAVLARADGVHLGQDDLPLEAAREFAPGLQLGVSTHDPFQLERALAAAPAYVAFGPVFSTRSKRNPEPCVGLAGLQAAAESARAAGCPLVAIGGITLAHAPALAELGVVAAVILDLIPASGALAEVEARALSLQRALGGGWAS